MEIKILAVKTNPLLKRKEVEFSVEHGPKGKTPERMQVKKMLAAELRTNEDLVFVKKMRTATGTSMAIGFANAYENKEQSKRIEPEYIIKRNSPHEKSKEEAKE